MPKPVDFIATFHKRTQDADGEWQIVLKADAGQDGKVAKLSPFFGECTVKVTVELYQGQTGFADVKDGDDGESEES